MTTNTLTLFCLVEGEAKSHAFSVTIDRFKTVDSLKDLIKAKISNTFIGFDARDLILWQVKIPDDGDDGEQAIQLENIPKKEKNKLQVTKKLSRVFVAELPEDMIHIMVQRPRPQIFARPP
ncbi:hypothetical protein BGZ74_004104, partial [Mortierella antarctica]